MSTLALLLLIGGWVGAIATVMHGNRQARVSPRSRKSAIEDWIIWPSTVWINHKDGRHETPHEGIERLNREL